MKVKIGTKIPKIDENIHHRAKVIERVKARKLREIDVENGAYDYKPPVIPINIIKEKKRSYLIGLNIAIENSFRQILP